MLPGIKIIGFTTLSKESGEALFADTEFGGGNQYNLTQSIKVSILGCPGGSCGTPGQLQVDGVRNFRSAKHFVYYGLP